MKKNSIKACIATALLFMMVNAEGAQDNELYFIDAHSQVDHTVVPLERVLSTMEQGGVTHTILSARGELQGKTILNFADRHSDRITPAVRTKGNHYDAGSPKYYKALKAQIASGKYSAMAEILLYHAQKGSKAPEVVVYPEDKRVLAALSNAIENQWPFMIHIEFSSLHGTKKQRFMESLENMLADHPELPFVLTHMGQLGPDECRRLIEQHKNIHFHTGWSNPVAVRRSNQPWINLFEGQRLSPEWSNLFSQYPERFVFALDNVFAEHWASLYQEQMEYWKKALSELPPQAAHLIAHGNAERLWRIAQQE